MATLGRDIYQNFFLNGDHGFAYKLFVNAIRFSTHGEFFCKSSVLEEGLSHYHHLHYQELCFESVAFFKVINFHKESFNISDHSESNISSLSSTLNFRKNCPLGNLRAIDFVVNCDLSITYVCSIDTAGMPVHEERSIEELVTKSCLENLNLTPASTITFKISGLPAEQPELYINRISEHWDIYRSIGINLPLLVIQIVLGRNVSTAPMVSNDDLVFSRSGISYNLKGRDVIWFDLDETLICKLRPVQPVKKLLFSLKSIGKSVKLITRHTFDIEETLSKIGIVISDFEEVVKVEEYQKKSSYINERDVFIDNEFPQRLDVRSKSKALVMDLDQIDFIKIDIADR
jgi:hypothetical protein